MPGVFFVGSLLTEFAFPDFPTSSLGTTRVSGAKISFCRRPSKPGRAEIRHVYNYLLRIVLPRNSLAVIHVRMICRFTRYKQQQIQAVV